MSTVRQLLRLLMPYRLLLLLLIVVAILVVGSESLGLGTVLVLLSAGNANGSVLKIPWLGTRIGEIATWSIETRIYAAALALVVITLVRSSLEYAQQLISLRLRRQVERALQERIFRRFHEISLDLLQRERRGAWMALLGQYARRVGSLILRFGQAIASIVILITYLILASVVSWPLTLLSLVLLLPIGLLLRPLIGTRLRAASRKTRDLMKETQSIAQEQLKAMKLIRMFGQEEWSHTNYQQRLDAYLTYEYQAAALSELTRPLFALLNVLMLAAVLLLGVTFLDGSPETLLAQLLIFLTIALRLIGPIGTLAQFPTEAAQTAPMLQSILEVLESDYPLAPRSGTLPFMGLRQGIELKNLSFRYTAGEALVLENLNLTIAHRQITAIVGVSGAGKSSLVNLLARLYDPTAGEICVDGTDLRQFDLVSWRRRIAVVSQDVVLFHADVWENLRFARSDATDAEIIQAAKLARAHDFIVELPNGYATVLQEEGMRLSGGQRQRIALARALLVDADLLILDEATSELDAITAQAVEATLRDVGRERAVLVIAHRLSAVVNADHIYVLQDGQVIEAGTHAQLVDKQELYYQLMQAQQV